MMTTTPLQPPLQPPLTVGLPLYNSAQDPAWQCSIGCLQFAGAEKKPSTDTNESDDGDDTAQSLWSASWSFATCVLQQKKQIVELLQGRSVVELGAGTGAGGLAVAASGMSTLVKLTDLPSNIHILEAAIRKNQHCIPETTTVEVGQLRWGAKMEREVESKFDVVLAIDCIYCHTLHDILAATAARICKTGGRILVADEARWSDNDKWWNETATLHGLVLVQMIELPRHERIPRKVVLRVYRVEEK
jgi:predicted nicotinamide N-methyase